jgi:hypothetical protein
MPLVTIRYVVGGANPKTSSVQVNLDDSGNGTSYLTLSGANSGVDTVQAYIDAKNLTSNPASVGWQATNGPIALTGAHARVYAGTGSGVFPANLGSVLFEQDFNSLMFNSHPQSILPGDVHQSGNQATPFVNNAITHNGTYSGDVVVQGNGVQAGASGSNYNFSMVLTGSFVVAAAGNVTFTAYADAAYVMGVSGAKYVSGPTILGGLTKTPINGFPLLCGQNNNTQDWHISSALPQTLYFPGPGVYPFEICYSTANHDEREFALLASNAVIPPVTATVSPLASTVAGTSLSLVPAAAGLSLVGSQVTFTLQVAGVPFVETTYIPMLEGVAGSIAVINQAGTSSYVVPGIPAGSTAKAVLSSALTELLMLTGSNAAWQNRISLALNPANTGILLNYNGSSLLANVATTMLTLTASDSAMYDQSSGQYDVYQYSSQGGGSMAQLPIYWLVAPVIASVTPSSLPPNTKATISVTLSKPLAPIQNTIEAVFTGSGGLIVTNVQVNTNSSGFVTGWTLTVTTPNVGSATSVKIGLVAQDSITYLNGNTFTTGSHVYISTTDIGGSLTVV